MSLRGQALEEFDLPVAPQRIDEFPPPCIGAEAFRVHAPAGRFLVLCSDGALAVAFEATLFDLLAEARYPAPRPRRARGGALIAKLDLGRGHAAAACYPLSSGESIDGIRATTPQLLDIGRLLARLHHIGEAHPASVVAPIGGADLAERLPRCAQSGEPVPPPPVDLTAPSPGAP